MIVDDALQAIPEHGLPEVHQQPERQLHEPQIGENLLSVNRKKPVDRLQLDDQAMFDEQVDLESVVYDNASIIQSDGDLAFDRKASLPESFGHQRFIRTFQQAWPEVIMYMKPAIDHDASYSLQLVYARHLRVFA